MIGERIHFFRTMRGMAQKYLGRLLGFPERSANVRLAQYETGSRTPKAELTAVLAQVPDVSPHALIVPDIDSYVDLMHTLFALEDNYGLTICEKDDDICLCVDKSKGKDAIRLHEMLLTWRQTAAIPCFPVITSTPSAPNGSEGELCNREMDCHSHFLISARLKVSSSGM